MFLEENIKSSVPCQDSCRVSEMAIQNPADSNACVKWKANGYRLPTEAQWEFAVRYIDGSSWLPGDHISGNTSGPYNDGNADVYAVFQGSGSTAAVGSKTANQLNIHDMSGNVREWCWDWDGNYAGVAQSAPAGPPSGAARGYRGGSWLSVEANLRVSDRASISPDFKDPGLGFRLAR